MTSNIAEALSKAVDIIDSQRSEIEENKRVHGSMFELNQHLMAENKRLTDELASYKQLEADAQADIDRLNALLPSPPPVPSGESPAPEPQAEVVTEAQIVPELQPEEPKTPDWATPPVPTADPATNLVQTDSPAVGM